MGAKREGKNMPAGIDAVETRDDGASGKGNLRQMHFQPKRLLLVRG